MESGPAWDPEPLSPERRSMPQMPDIDRIFFFTEKIFHNHASF
ncbi:hypothetical protein AA0522_2035 [Gluconacetobacter liquefaciens NRIC 0522]|nr:hypothetical protein AA0522_2035 [Gluconacetobacter liquefaciens NRIC 0522]